MKKLILSIALSLCCFASNAQLFPYWDSTTTQNYVARLYAPLISPALTGTPTSITGGYGDAGNRISTDAFVYFASPVIVQGAFSSTTVVILPTTKAITGSQIFCQDYTSGNYVWSTSSGISTTGVTVYGKASTSDSIRIAIYNHL